MALENYIEMRDSVNDPLYKKRRELEFELEEKFSDRFIPRYSMVSFHDIPYSKVYERGIMQLNLINEYLSGGISKEKLHERVLDELPPLK
jgi:kynurenine 3-monooxygenase